MRCYHRQLYSTSHPVLRIPFSSRRRLPGDLSLRLPLGGEAGADRRLMRCYHGQHLLDTSSGAAHHLLLKEKASRRLIIKASPAGADKRLMRCYHRQLYSTPHPVLLTTFSSRRRLSGNSASRLPLGGEAVADRRLMRYRQLYSTPHPVLRTTFSSRRRFLGNLALRLPLGGEAVADRQLMRCCYGQHLLDTSSGAALRCIHIKRPRFAGPHGCSVIRYRRPACRPEQG